MRWLVFSLLVVILACSDDSSGPAADGRPDKGSVDAKGPAGDKGKPADDSGNLPWPDLPVYKDATAWKCTPGAAGMCDDNKFFQCKNGVCAPCPANYVDCDRKDDCECYGACKGTKCVGGK